MFESETTSASNWKVIRNDVEIFVKSQKKRKKLPWSFLKQSVKHINCMGVEFREFLTEHLIQRLIIRYQHLITVFELINFAAYVADS